jgi:PAS domain S-box-containing protein
MVKDGLLKVDIMKPEVGRGVHLSSEAKLRNILEKANECIIFLDKTGHILDVNRKTSEVFGYSKGEVIGKHFTKLNALVIKDIPKVMNGFAKILSGKDATLDLMIKNKEGDLRSLKCSGSLIQFEGKFIGIMIIVQDVTEREQMQSSLQHSEDRYRKLVESIQDVLYSLDKDGNITSVNKAVKTLLGLEPEEVIGRNIGEFVPKEELPKVRVLLKPDRRVKKASTEIRVLDKDGQLHEVEFHSTPIMKDGQVIGRQGIVRDVTKRKKMEEELRLSQQRFKILFEYAPDAFYLINLQGEFIDGNKVMEELFGYSKKQFIGKTFFNLKLFPRQDREKVTKLFAVNAMGKPTGPDEFSLRCRDGRQIDVEISTYPVKIEGKIVVLGIAHDITERMKNEQALRESEEKYRNLFDLAPDGITTITRTGTITSVNAAFSRLTGFSKEELMGKHFTKIGTLRRRDDFPTIRKMGHPGGLKPTLEHYGRRGN